MNPLLSAPSLLAHTKILIIASGIANIYARDATATKRGQHSLAKLYDGRFLLGLGVSHVTRAQ
jgi:alkanesulfonate monooxygenase SsuD/methylene tetrahydromethanopterin reductase-like flavin-dependent oxidoreductase (luciferase family)